MAKNKNKGFSLIEIVIAIAIMTLLLTPIVQQLAATMKTNRKVKAQQHASENAQYVMEYFQNESLDTLGRKAAAPETREIYPVNDVEAKTFQCDMYELLADGTVSSDPVLSDMEYSVYEYDLNSYTVSNTHTTYDRTVIMDDLTVQVMSEKVRIGTEDYSFKVAFNLTEAPSGFTLTNEGSAVMYDGDNHVTAIVCKRTGLFDEKGIKNPNEMNLGDVHDLRADLMPIITGTATDFDNQADNQFYALAMERLKNIIDPTSGLSLWEIEMAGGSGDKSYLKNGQYLDNLRKMTEIKIWEDDDYYYFRVNAYYENSYAIESGKKPDQLEYCVYYQKFAKVDDEGNAVKVPSMYFEYQPYLTGASENIQATYAEREFIVIDNTVKDAVIYLFKPKWDAATRYLADSLVTGEASYEDESLILNKSDAYYVMNNAGQESHDGVDEEKVAIGIMTAQQVVPEEAEGAAGEAAPPEETGVKQRQATIYTNLNLETVDERGSQFLTTVTSSSMPQGGSYVSISSIFDSAFKTWNEEGTTGTKRGIFSFDKNYLKPIGEEGVVENRFFTVSVVLTPDNTGSNIVRLNGAKGGN